jgi:hypothetical protein
VSSKPLDESTTVLIMTGAAGSSPGISSGIGHDVVREYDSTSTLQALSAWLHLHQWVHNFELRISSKNIRILKYSVTMSSNQAHTWLRETGSTVH